MALRRLAGFAPKYGPAIKILVLSASVVIERRQKVLKDGADDFLAKPFLESDLLEMIKKLTGVDYIYSEQKVLESPTPAKDASSMNMDILQLPLEIVDSLREAACRADYKQILLLIDRITPQNELLGCQLRQLAERF